MCGEAESRAAEGARIEDRLEELHRRTFIGRRFELSMLESFAERPGERPERIVNVYGPGGIGKSHLLDRFRRQSLAAGRRCLAIDLRAAGRSPEALCRLLLGRLFPDAAGEEPDGRRGGETTRRAVDALNRAAEEGPLTLLFDHYEELGGGDGWFRDALIARLSARLSIVVASRRPLHGPWAIDPAWRRMTVSLPVGPFEYEELRRHAPSLGLASDPELDALWIGTQGHPLAVALWTSSRGRGAVPAGQPGYWDALVGQWLLEADGDEALSELLLAASIPRCFQQEGLSVLLDRDVPDGRFDRLTSLSFVRRTEEGWGVHDVIRDSLRRSFRARRPEAFERAKRRYLEYVYNRIERKLARGHDAVSDIGELLQYLGSPIVRAHYRHAGFSDSYLEPIDASMLEEAEAYLARRRSRTKAVRIRCADPESGTLFRYDLTAEQHALRVHGIDPAALLAADPRSLRAVRDENGRMIGLAAAVPIHAATIDFLAAAPFARAYFASLTPERRDALRAPPERPAGWYIFTIDMEDLEKETHRSDIVHIMLDWLLSGALVVAAPPPLPHYEAAHLGLGFEAAPDAAHRDYGGETLAPTYVADTRGDKLLGYLRRMAGKTRPPAGPSTVPERFGFSAREREVLSHLLQGATNAEIAAALFISEAAVKKHIQSMLGKSGTRNRTQLVTSLRES